jgi:hypothetical protein
MTAAGISNVGSPTDRPRQSASPQEYAFEHKGFAACFLKLLEH